MSQMARAMISEILGIVAESLDIPENKRNDAVMKYEALGRHLNAVHSTLARYAPEIYPQGSFMLGTVTRPVGRELDYDVDLVCELEIAKDAISQRDLKRIVGSRIREWNDYDSKISDGRRCWTLEFPDHFHMDVLPAIPDSDHEGNAILITDKELFRWQHSNPKEYAKWFYDVMRPALTEARLAVAAQYNKSVEEIPDWRVRTPLQRSIQILKRHRDWHFRENPDKRPASIIITTLAARSYVHQPCLHETLLAVVDGMFEKVVRDHGDWIVVNPVDERENFAERWNEDADRATLFFSWLKRAQEDLRALLEGNGLGNLGGKLELGFGKRVAERAMKQYGDIQFERRSSSQLRMAAGTGVLSTGSAAGSVSVKPHTFFGS